MTRSAALALVAAAAGGCASLGPPAPPTTPTTQAVSRAPAATRQSPVAEAQATHEYPSAPPRPQSAPGSGSAAGAVARFAQAYINWDARTVAADMASLARQSVGQARSEMELAAAQTASDYELRRGGIANRGTVEVVSPLHGSQTDYVVVTRERTTASATNAYRGLRPAWHVALATAVRLAPGRWAVSGWEPEG